MPVSCHAQIVEEPGRSLPKELTCGEKRSAYMYKEALWPGHCDTCRPGRTTTTPLQSLQQSDGRHSPNMRFYITLPVELTVGTWPGTTAVSRLVASTVSSFYMDLAHTAQKVMDAWSPDTQAWQTLTGSFFSGNALLA